MINHSSHTRIPFSRLILSIVYRTITMIYSNPFIDETYQSQVSQTQDAIYPQLNLNHPSQSLYPKATAKNHDETFGKNRNPMTIEDCLRYHRSNDRRNLPLPTY